MKVTLGFKNLDTFISEVEKQTEAAVNACAAAVYSQALALDEVINRQGMVPVDSGALRASHYVTLPVANGDGTFTSELGYGAPYAAEVHERKGGGDAGMKFRGLAGVARGKKLAHGTPQWMKRGSAVWSRSLQARFSQAFRVYWQNRMSPANLLGAAPTAPTFGGAVSRHERRYGNTTEEWKTMNARRKKGLAFTVGKRRINRRRR